MYKGSCLCGAISFLVEGELREPDACHCLQCRKSSGHYYVSTDVPRSSLDIEGEESITWYNQSEKIRRGFCSKCGTPLFYDPIDKEKHNWIGISMGSFNDQTNTKLGIHIFVEEKGDYYEIKDDLLQYKRTPE